MSTRGLDGGDTGKFSPATAGWFLVLPREGCGTDRRCGWWERGAPCWVSERTSVWGPRLGVWRLGFLGPIASLHSYRRPVGPGLVFAGGVVVGCLLRCG